VTLLPLRGGTSQIGVSLVSTIKTTLAYKISTKRQWQFETNLESSLETIRVHSEVLLEGNSPEKSKGLLLGCTVVGNPGNLPPDQVNF
jgi:predicted transposase YdaD